jgi:hypothetical protein
MDPVLLYAAFAVVITVWTGNYVATRVGRDQFEAAGACRQPVMDVGHALVPQINLPLALTIGITLFWVPFVAMSSARTAIVQRIGLRVMLLFALRAITNVVTILPKQEACEAKFKWYMLFNGACYDKVFSGHSALAVLVSLALVTYGVWPAWAGWTYTSGMVLMLLVSRGHYTVDIVLGLALAFMSWNMSLPWNST